MSKRVSYPQGTAIVDWHNINWIMNKDLTTICFVTEYKK